MATLSRLRRELHIAESEYTLAQFIDDTARMIRERADAAARIERLKELIAEAEEHRP